MDNSDHCFNEQALTLLIDGLVVEKERYEQERLANKIGNIKNERTAQLVADLLYSEDAYIRNAAIEILIVLDETALQVLSEKLLDSDRNIRKFALDALKHIKGRRSCEIALTALNDPDENVVEAALEVLAEQSYKEATGKLLEVLEETNSIWITNALLRTFESLDARRFTEMIAQKIISINATAIEKNVLMNTFVRTLGTIGSHADIEQIINKYSKNFVIEDSNLVFSLCSLIVNNQICRLPEKEIVELERIFKDHWEYKDSSQLLVSVAAFVQLQLDFFLHDIQEIFEFYKGEEFFAENLYDLLQKLNRIPDSFVNEILASEEPELVMMGLKLIHKKEIRGFNSIVEKLCNSQDGEIAKLAVFIIAEGKCEIDDQDIDSLLCKLEHQSKKVRKAAAQKLAVYPGVVNLDLLQEMIRRKPGVEGIEALEVLFRLNADIGWKHITQRMDCMNEYVRAGLVGIIEYSSDSLFYSFMNTMINDPSPVVRKKAIKVLNKKIDDRSLLLLEKLYDNESDPVNRMEIVINLYRFQNDHAFNMANRAVVSTDILTRIAAIHSLGLFHNNRAGAVLQSLLADPVEEVREAAMEALYEIEVTK